MIKVFDGVAVIELYDKDGKFIAKIANPSFRDLLKLRDVIIGILLALAIASQVMV